MQVELYFPLLEIRKGVPPKNIDDLLKSYAESLALSLEQWHQGTMTDAQSLWLNQWIQSQQLTLVKPMDPESTVAKQPGSRPRPYRENTKVASNREGIGLSHQGARHPRNKGL